MKTHFITYLLVLFAITDLFGQKNTSNNTISLLFIGDIMGHDSQINSAYIDSSGSYNYENVFRYIKPNLENADFAIANLEVTLAGAPYKGYPQFSSHEKLATACKNAGIDVLVTANNHSCDRSKEGILETIRVLDSINILHTGTFRDSKHRKKMNLLVLNKNNIRVGILNYTYGTNGLPAPLPTIVNYIDTNQIVKDIEASKVHNLDKLILFLHWGNEYQSHPSKYQIELANFLFSKSVDIIIGSHPHVLQKMVWEKKNDENQERFIAYSLGNFVSNQRTRKTDGGAIIEIRLVKVENETYIENAGYYLTWVYKKHVNGNPEFYILPCSKYEEKGDFFSDDKSFEKMKIFINDSRKLLQNENTHVDEFRSN